MLIGTGVSNAVGIGTIGVDRGSGVNVGRKGGRYTCVAEGKGVLIEFSVGLSIANVESGVEKVTIKF